MARFTPTLITLLLPLLCAAFAIAAVPSGTVGCSCPMLDEGGYPFLIGGTDGSLVVCGYGIPSDPGPYSCSYDGNTHLLTFDDDDGECYASLTCTSTRKRFDDNYTAMKRRQEAKAEMPRASYPSYMLSRSSLGSAKRRRQQGGALRK